MNKTIKSFKTIGGKSRLLPTLLPIIKSTMRENGLRGFLDLFGGGNKFIPHLSPNLAPERIYNELDNGISNLMACLTNRQQTTELLELTYKIRNTINSQADLDSANVKRRSEETNQIESAALTLLVSEYSRAADRKIFLKNNVLRGITRGSLNRYHELVPVMRDVTVTCASYSSFFDNYNDRYDFLAFLDPPYVNSDIYLDRFGMTEQMDMMKRIVNTQMKVILCGTDNEEYDYLRKSDICWNKYCLGSIQKHSASKHGAMQYEFIWTNFDVNNRKVIKIW